MYQATKTQVKYLYFKEIYLFVQARERVRGFQDAFPGVAIPPEPVVTRWGSWLNAALYYRDHFDFVETFLGALDPKEASAFETAQELASLPAIKLQLVAISANYKCVIRSITQLETAGMPITESVQIVEQVKESLQLNDGLISGIL